MTVDQLGNRINVGDEVVIRIRVTGLPADTRYVSGMVVGSPIPTRLSAYSSNCRLQPPPATGETGERGTQELG